MDGVLAGLWLVYRRYRAENCVWIVCWWAYGWVIGDIEQEILCG